MARAAHLAGAVRTIPDPGTGGVVQAMLLPHAPILVPEVGGAETARAAATTLAMRRVAREVARCAPDVLVVVSPHAPVMPGEAGLCGAARVRGDLGRFGAPGAAIDLPGAPEFAEALAGALAAGGLQAGRLAGSPLDHGSVVPLCYLAEAGWRGATVIVGWCGGEAVSGESVGRAVAQAAADRHARVTVLASGDMSHRLTPDAPAGYHRDAARFDRTVIECLERGDYQAAAGIDPDWRAAAAEDVIDPVTVAAAAAGWSADGHAVLSYEGPWGVGYGVAVLFDAQAAELGPPAWAALARHAVADALRLARREPAWPEVVAPPAGEGGVFVTIHGPGGTLRGCIGLLGRASGGLVTAVWKLAHAAAFEDPRFPPVKAHEFAGLSFEVNLLHPPEPVASTDELDPARYGVVVHAADGRRAVLLPGIPELATAEAQIDAARRKAGIGADEEIQVERFLVTRCVEAPAREAG